jgi:hypothetical protein
MLTFLQVFSLCCQVTVVDRGIGIDVNKENITISDPLLLFDKISIAESKDPERVKVKTFFPSILYLCTLTRENL